MGAPSHWLAEQLDQVQGLMGQLQSRRRQVENGVGARAAHGARRQLRDTLQGLAEQVAERSGVRCCFVASEGLVFAQAGDTRTSEAFAAMAQLWCEYGGQAAQSLELGRPEQMVLVGRHAKLALFPLGSMVLGVVADSGTCLADVLSQ